MIADLPPGLVMIIGGLLVPLIPERLRGGFMLAVPLAGFLQLLTLEHGSHHVVEIFTYALVQTRVDKLSLVFGYIFYIAAFLGVVYSLHLRDPMQQVPALVYPGAAVGAVFAGDLITLFIYWELTAISSVFLIWASRSEIALTTGLRYLVIQVGSGVLLLAGVILQVRETGSIAFDDLGLTGLPSLLIFLAFGIKCAFPLLHNWLQDAYPKATVCGTVILSAFTTKLAVYALARGFPGTDALIWIGAAMTLFPIFFAEIENDFRKVLSYSLNNQLGFMVCGIGIGTEMAINGAVAHAFAHIIYKALLFMSMGAVLFRTGTVKGSEMGGLYKSMPWTAGFCMVGAASISAFPLFSGFVSKSLILTAAAEEGHWITFLALLFASAGVLFHAGIKIPFFAFFAHDSGIRCKEAPWNMLAAMAAAAFLCIAIGVYPAPLYAILPFPVDFAPYTAGHVITQVQLLLFSVLAFVVLLRSGLYPPELPATNLDTDWLYRRALPRLVARLREVGAAADQRLRESAIRQLTAFLRRVYRHHGPQGILARTWPTGSTVLWMALLLAAYLLHYYL